MRSQISVNYSAEKLVKRLQERSEYYGVTAKKTKSGATIIDAGIKGKGGFLAGKVITEICLGGYGEAEIFFPQSGDLKLPYISVYTDHPAIATLGSQFAGWQIKVGKFFAMGSGPARALALKPREIYEEIEYEDKANVAVLVLETTKEPSEEVLKHVSDQCGVSQDGLFMILVPTSTVAGSTQISGRIVETGIHKLSKLGLNPNIISHAWGYAPIAPVHPRFAEAMGRTNDAILYGGVAGFTLKYDDEEKLKQIIERAPSVASKSHGKPFFEIFKEANYDFYKIDPFLFAPAVVTVNNTKTGKTFTAGKISLDIFYQSLEITRSQTDRIA